MWLHRVHSHHHARSMLTPLLPCADAGGPSTADVDDNLDVEACMEAIEPVAGQPHLWPACMHPDSVCWHVTLVAFHHHNRWSNEAEPAAIAGHAGLSTYVPRMQSPQPHARPALQACGMLTCCHPSQVIVARPAKASWAQGSTKTIINRHQPSCTSEGGTLTPPSGGPPSCT